MKFNLVKVLFNFRVTQQQQQAWDLCWLASLFSGIWVSISKYNAGSGLSALSEKVGSRSFLHRLNTGSSLGVNELYQILSMVVVCLWGAPQVTCLLFFLLSRSTVFCCHTTIVASTLLHFPQRDDVFMLHRILCPTLLTLSFGQDSGSYFLRESIAMLLKLASDLLPTSALGLQMCTTTPGLGYCFDWSWFRISFRFSVGSR